jgi:hypothetical protein
MPAACCGPSNRSSSGISAPSLVPAALRKLLQPFRDAPPTPSLGWTVVCRQLPCFVKISPHTPFFRPFCTFILKQTEPGSFSVLDRTLDPSLWSPPHSCDALPPLEKVLEAVTTLARRLGESPSSLLFVQDVYVAALTKLVGPLGVAVAAATPGDAASLEGALRPVEEELGNVVVAKAPKMNYAARPGHRFGLLRDASPKLRDAHLRAFFALANDLVALHPWSLSGLDESSLLRVYFPGGAEPAPGYRLPPGEVYWVQVNGQSFLRDFARAQQAAQQAGGGPLRLSVERDFGIRVFMRRSDADGFILASLNRDMLVLQQQRKEKPHPRAVLPCVARPTPREAQCCLVCGAPGSSCKKCGGVAYCGAACAAQNAEAHKATCSPPAAIVPGHPPCAQVAGSTLKVKLFDLHDAPLGEAEEVGRVGGALADGEDVPVAVMEHREGIVSRPPLLELTRLIRALGVVTTFLRDKENMMRSSVPAPSEESFVPFGGTETRLVGGTCVYKGGGGAFFFIAILSC